MVNNQYVIHACLLVPWLQSLKEKFFNATSPPSVTVGAETTHLVNEHMLSSCCPNRFLPFMACWYRHPASFDQFPELLFPPLPQPSFFYLFLFLFCVVSEPQKHRIMLIIILTSKHTVIIGPCILLFYSIFK